MMQKMHKFHVAVLLFLTLCLPALALPRDSVAVLNRCGKPLKGETTIYENSLAGGRRILSYERGTLYFDRVENDGWTFVKGDHGKQKDLNAEEMEKFLPCLKDALADSAEPTPLKPVTSVTRVETSVKRTYEKHILLSLLGLVLVGLVLYLWAMKERRDRAAQGLDED